VRHGRLETLAWRHRRRHARVQACTRHPRRRWVNKRSDSRLRTAARCSPSRPRSRSSTASSAGRPPRSRRATCSTSRSRSRPRSAPRWRSRRSLRGCATRRGCWNAQPKSSRCSRRRPPRGDATTSLVRHRDEDSVGRDSREVRDPPSSYARREARWTHGGQPSGPTAISVPRFFGRRGGSASLRSSDRPAGRDGGGGELELAGSEVGEMAANAQADHANAVGAVEPQVAARTSCRASSRVS
jgi:hypothetical protein